MKWPYSYTICMLSCVVELCVHFYICFVTIKQFKGFLKLKLGYCWRGFFFPSCVFSVVTIRRAYLDSVKNTVLLFTMRFLQRLAPALPTDLQEGRGVGSSAGLRTHHGDTVMVSRLKNVALLLLVNIVKCLMTFLLCVLGEFCFSLGLRF